MPITLTPALLRKARSAYLRVQWDDDEAVPENDAVTARRFDLLGGPRGETTCLPVGDPRRDDRFRAWVLLLRVNRPLTQRLADEAARWAHEVYGT